MNDFERFIADCRERVDNKLTGLIPTLEDGGERLRDAMRYSLFNGGKRVRPILVYAGGLAIDTTLSDKQIETLDTIACAVECIHAYSLVHDDLPAMDDDDLRRGKPTCHIAFDEANAILAGDALQTLAFELLCQTPHATPAIRLELLKQLTRAAGIHGMVLGQAIDLAAVNQQVDLTYLETMHHHKTGALIGASVVMGAIACGATTAQLNALRDYATVIGLAFQVQDDILDVTVDTDTLGKQQGADAARNKPTYVSLLGLENAQKKARELQQQALATLNTFDQSAGRLRELAAYIIERNH